MNLRHKKPINSYKGQASNEDDKLLQKQIKRTNQNQILAHFNPDNSIKMTNDNKKSLSELLSSFISNSNYAFKNHCQKKSTVNERQDQFDTKKKQIIKNRKRSEQLESYEQKKIETNLNDRKQKPTSQNKNQKESRNNLNGFKKNVQNKTKTEVSFSQNVQLQNIINQQNNSNILNYLPTLQQNFYFPLLDHRIPQFLYNYPSTFPSLNTMPTNVLNYNIQNQMRNGLIRQMQIYQFYKQQYERCPNLKDKEINLQKQKQKEIIKNPIKKSQHDKPEKIMKRASYHVGIAYMIYLDKIKKSGDQIKSIESIDPTKQARKFKQNHNNKI